MKLKNITLRNIQKVIDTFGTKKGGAADLPALVKVPAGQNVLILAPHFDDETIGCGGTIRKHILGGNRVSVVYITDGREGIPDLKDKKKVTEIRKGEAQKAMEILGVRDIYYLNEIDMAERMKEETVHELRKVIDGIRPDLIYLPWFLDNHVDHVKTNKLLRQVHRESNRNFNVCAYEVWTPMVPNIMVDISETIELKKKALSCFESQLKQVDYLSTTLGLNRYRSCYMHGGRSFVEAFLHMKAQEYFSLF